MLRKQSLILVSLLLIGFSFTAIAGTTDADKMAVKDKYYQWCSSLAKANGDASVMVRFYSHDATLLPTLSQNILTNKDGGLDKYFKTLTLYPNIKCTPKSLNTRMYKETAINSGLYMFSYTDKNNNIVDIPARFTFVYRKENGDWLIIKHHSSKMPSVKID